MFKESLTVEERKRLDRQHGPGRIRVIHEIEKERVFAGMPPKERARIAALPKPARRQAEHDAVHRARDEHVAKIMKLIAEEIRNGDWNYARFTPAKAHRKINQAKCLACHKPLHDADYLFSYEDLVSKTR